jgi:hypothetical protein
MNPAGRLREQMRHLMKPPMRSRINPVADFDACAVREVPAPDTVHNRLAPAKPLWLRLHAWVER